MMSFTEAHGKLSAFETADEIAEFLKEQEILAYKQKVFLCAMSKWMSKETGLHVGTVGATIAVVTDGVILEEKILTEAMKDFVRLFDQGKYPDITRDSFIMGAGPDRVY